MSAPSIPGLHVRPMNKQDISAVMSIENESYEHPWTESIMTDCLRVGYMCFVVEVDSDVVGHLIMSEAVGEAHLLNICVSPRWQGRGIGKLLLKWAISVAGKVSADTLFLEVRVSNKAALHMYDMAGFNEIGLRRNYYPAKNGRREDAMLFARAI